MSSTALDPTFLLQRLQAVAEETRLHLVQMLAGGERCVCELQDDLGGAAQSRLSFHLRKLKEAGVVSDRKEGRWVYYTLVPGALDEMRDFLGELAAGRALLPHERDSMTSRRALTASGPVRRENGGGCCAPKPGGSAPPGKGCC